MRRTIRCALAGAVCFGHGVASAQYLDEPRNRCAADLAGPDGVLNFFDIARFVQLHAAGSPQADVAAPWGVLDFFDIARYLEAFTRGCGVDADGDGIPDWAETNDGVCRGPFATGTDPLNPDTDGDGLSDGDEVFGTSEGLDLPALGADPFRKDVFIECDWFEGVFEGAYRNFRPRDAAVARVAAMFDAAPVPNPFGRPDGVRLHMDYGQGGVFIGGERLPGAPVFITFPGEFDHYKAAHFDPRRLGYFHYAVFANRYNSADNRSSGVAEIVGDDLMITMVDYLSNFNQSQTIAHELGHNLGLRHGGFENRNWKPNYNSVMNYRHQFAGIDFDGDTLGDGGLDYSSGRNAEIDESAVYEPAGVLGFPVDFNRDGIIQPTPYARNLNCPGAGAPCGSWGIDCADSVCNVLADHDDWGSIAWWRLDAAHRVNAEIADCEHAPQRAD